MKTIKIYIKLIFTFMLAVFFIACEDVVQIDLDDANLDLINVEAYLTTRRKDNISVKIEKTLQVDNASENPPENNAIVEISDNETPSNKIMLREIENSGIYILPSSLAYPTSPGRTYTLKITTTEGVIITGEDYLQEVEPLDTVKVNLSARGDYEYLGVFISTQETPDPGHYYKWDIYINNRLLYDGDNLAFANDDLVDGNYIYDLEIFTDWFDEENEDSDGNIESDRIIFLGDTVKVLQSSISSNIYDFYLGMQNQAFAGGPFSVPPANITGNLSANNNKKVLGFFSARDVSLGNSVIIDEGNFTPISRSLSF